MFCWTDEGSDLKPGFNFYRLEDAHSFGFKLRIGDGYVMVRYRKAFNDLVIMARHRKHMKDFSYKSGKFDVTQLPIVPI